VTAETIGTLGNSVGVALTGPGTDPSRVLLAQRYLGDLSTPPVDRFLQEVDRTLALVQSTHPARTMPITDLVGAVERVE
jgi:hypothetical protein